MTELDCDLAPVYGPPKSEHAAGMSRQTMAEIRAYHRQALENLDRVNDGCAGCLHARGRLCTHWQQTMPKEYDGSDCDAWAYDGIPF